MKNFFSILVTVFVTCFVAACSQNKATVELPKDMIEESDFIDTSTKNQRPKPLVTVPSRILEATKVVVKVDANDPDSSTWTYMFDFDGNGVFDKVGETATVEYSWPQHGKYRLHVRVQDNQGETADSYANVVVEDGSPTAAFRVKGQITEGVMVRFDASPSKSPTDPITTYEWDLDYDGKQFRSSSLAGKIVDHRFLESRKYQVALRVTDLDGSQHTFVRSFDVADQAPKARIQGPKQLLVNEYGVFSGSDSRSVVDRIVGYYWDATYNGKFNREKIKNSKVLRKRWQSPGTYRVALLVKDADGSETITTHQVKVVAPEPVANPQAKPEAKK